MKGGGHIGIDLDQKAVWRRRQLAADQEGHVYRKSGHGLLCRTAAYGGGTRVWRGHWTACACHTASSGQAAASIPELD
jgi:hypothetical protein